MIIWLKAATAIPTKEEVGSLFVGGEIKKRPHTLSDESTLFTLTHSLTHKVGKLKPKMLKAYEDNQEKRQM